jgi:hypothetical protein
MNINKDWHLANKMAKNPTLDQRVEWHVEHTKLHLSTFGWKNSGGNKKERFMC